MKRLGREVRGYIFTPPYAFIICTGETLLFYLLVKLVVLWVVPLCNLVGGW